MNSPSGTMSGTGINSCRWLSDASKTNDNMNFGNTLLQQMTNTATMCRQSNSASANADPLASLIDQLFEPEQNTAAQEEEGQYCDPIPLAARSGGCQDQRLRSHSLGDFVDLALQEIDAECCSTDSMYGVFALPSYQSDLLNQQENTTKRSIDDAAGFLPTAVPSKPDSKRRRLVRLISDQDDTAPRFRPYQQQQWDTQFQELLVFKQQRGHCCVPHTFEENPMLSRWVKRQRYQYKLRQEGKASTITANRIQQLDAADFVWDSHSAAWEERLNDLKSYLLHNGHCNVPSTCLQRPQLATWVKCQRRQYKLFSSGKPSNITTERITALNRLGFKWDMRSGKKG